MSSEMNDSASPLIVADSCSRKIAKIIVETVGSITGMTRGTHRKGKFQSHQISRATAEISTISKARDLIRELSLEEYRSEKERKEIESHLNVCLDRLIILGLPTIPSNLGLQFLNTWSEGEALRDIKRAKTFICAQKEDMISKERARKRELFRDPKQRGRWFAEMFGTPQAGCPNYAVDETGKRTYDAEEVKAIYLKEGASFLRNKVPRPVEDEKAQWKPVPPPDISKPRGTPQQKPTSLPKWWRKMYSRNAKDIPTNVWCDLMNPVDWREVLKTISDSGFDKAAGCDGVSSDLVRLLTEDSNDTPTPLLSLLVSFINTAFEGGETLISWRKAIISMIPKRRDDGSFTDRVSEMRYLCFTRIWEDRFKNSRQ